MNEFTIGLNSVSPCLRTKIPYEARHMPWYNDTNKLNDEEMYYISHANARFQNIHGKNTPVGMWTQLDKNKVIKVF